jgi:hypothetical protein
MAAPHPCASRQPLLERILAALAMAALASAAGAAEVSPRPSADLGEAAAGRFVALALKCLHQEYPNHVSHMLLSDADARPPRELTPAFFGCLDWHSDVHGHWLLVRAIRLYPEAPFVPAARAAVAASLSDAHVAGELAYLAPKERASFERPYGLAWLLKLAAELRTFDDEQGRQWSSALQPLETEVAARFERWISNLHYPIRVGEHDQTAFAFSLVWDWARVAQDGEMRTLLLEAARRFYGEDRNCPLGYEPSGEDFLSPCLGEADFMRRVLKSAAFAHWLGTFLPQIPAAGRREWLLPAVVTDRSDPKLAHIDGLNLSRAWMLEGIAAALPPGDPRVPALSRAALRHRETSLPAVTGEHYEGGHWLGTFALYLTSRADLDDEGPASHR